jgi:hypothetical protein
MFERIATGWQLTRQSWRVLMLDKELLVFPFLSGIACLLVLVSFAVPMWTTGFHEQVLQERAAEQGSDRLFYQIAGGVILFAYYFVNYFVIVFFNSALVACAIIRFKGGNPNLREGFSAAGSLLPQILGWAAVAATVGVALRLIESRSEKIGQLVAGLLGMAWSIVTYFVVPVIVVERLGPFAAAKRSTGIVKQTWGESLTANFGISVIVMAATLLGIVPIIIGGVVCGMGMVPVGVASIVLGIGILLIISLVSSALHTIVLGALYLYAAERKVPTHFDEQLFRHAFAHK